MDIFVRDRSCPPDPAEERRLWGWTGLALAAGLILLAAYSLRTQPLQLASNQTTDRVAVPPFADGSRVQ